MDVSVAARQDLYRKEEHGTLDGHHQSSSAATQKASQEKVNSASSCNLNRHAEDMTKSLCFYTNSLKEFQLCRSLLNVLLLLSEIKN